MKMDINFVQSCMCSMIDPQQTTGAESDCFISDLLSGLFVGGSAPQVVNSTDLTPSCEPNTDTDDGYCTIVLESATIVFDGNVTATTANYTPFPAFCINGSLTRQCVEGVWVDENIIQKSK